MVLGKGGLGLAFSGSNADKETWAEWISISEKEGTDFGNVIGRVDR